MKTVILVLAFILLFASVSYANLSGFETVNFTGRTLSGNTGWTSAGSNFPHDGKYSAQPGPFGPDGYLTGTPFAAAPASQYSIYFRVAGNGPLPNGFGATDEPSFPYLDDVSGTKASVPEPSVAPLLGIGLVMALLVKRATNVFA